MNRILSSSTFFTIVLPIVCGIFIAFMRGDWTLIPVLVCMFAMGYFTHTLWMRHNGLTYGQVVGTCPVERCTYTCGAASPPDVTHMMVAHLREVHEIIPGVT